MISFTNAAEEQLKKAIVEGETVRIAVQGGGCSGMSYAMNLYNVWMWDVFFLGVSPKIIRSKLNHLFC